MIKPFQKKKRRFLMNISGLYTLPNQSFGICHTCSKFNSPSWLMITAAEVKLMIFLILIYCNNQYLEIEKAPLPPQQKSNLGNEEVHDTNHQKDR